jgi:hypothetical protein
MHTRFVALAVAATLGLGSVSAFAQDYRHHEGRQSGWQHRGHDGDRGQWAGHQRYAPRYEGRSHGYRYDNGDVIGALVLGGLAGALLGQAASPYGYAQPPATYYGPPAGYYAPPATYYGQPGYYAPAPAYSTPSYGYGYGYYGN